MFYRAVGCEECNSTGYRGRMRFTGDARHRQNRRLIAQNAGEDLVGETAVASGMLTLGEDGLARSRRA